MSTVKIEDAYIYAAAYAFDQATDAENKMTNNHRNRNVILNLNTHRLNW